MSVTPVIVELHSVDELQDALNSTLVNNITCVYILNDMWGISDIALDITQINKLNIRQITHMKFIYKHHIENADANNIECIVYDRLTEKPRCIECNRSSLIKYLDSIRPASSCIQLQKLNT